jgi:hypothetical protein
MTGHLQEGLLLPPLLYVSDVNREICIPATDVSTGNRVERNARFMTQTCFG